VFEGTDGWVLVDREGIYANPPDLLEWQPGPSDIYLCRSSGHVRNFLDCVRARRDTICNIDEAVRADTVCHLADIATRLGRKLRWDPQEEQFANDPQANRMLTRSMRSPWRI